MNSAIDKLLVLRAHIAELLGQLRILIAPDGPGGTLLNAMTEAQKSGNIVPVKDGARGLAKAVEELQVQLQDALMQAEQLEPTQRWGNFDSETFQLELKQALREARARSTDVALSVWLKFFGDAFAEWRLEVCEKLTREAIPATPELEDLQQRLLLAVKALLTLDHSAAVPGITLLVDEHPAGLPKSPIDGVSRAIAFLALGRILLYDKADDIAALTCFEKAREASPQEGRVQAALADYYRTKNDDAGARDLYRKAIAAAPDRPDGYVGMALLCEEQGWWGEAQDWYAQAVDTVLRRATSGDPLAELGQVLAPVSGALYLCLAQAVATTNPAAGLGAVDEAIKLGIKGAGKYPDCTAYQLRGEILATLQRPEEAAEAFFEAGWYYSWENNIDAACELYKRANKLDPQLVRNYWGWADVLLSACYISKPPYVDKEKIEQSLDVWNCGTKVGLPDEDYYWAYLTRALIAQQRANLPKADRWQCYWETVTFVEQALQLNPTRTLSWVILGQMHYALGNDLNALHATETALLSDPEDVSAIDERMYLLTNLNRYPDVWPLLAKRRSMEPTEPATVSAIEAHLGLYETPLNAGHQAYAAALAASDAAVLAGATAPWVCIDRARLFRQVRRTEEAQDAYEKLWRQFDEQDSDNQLSYAWAALMTGKFDAALNIVTSCSGDRIIGLSTIQRYFGFCRLLQGEFASAREHFDQAIELAHSARELDAWLIGDFETAEVLELLTGQQEAEQAREMLDQCKASAGKRRAALQPPTSSQQEMQQVIAALEAPSETVDWTWIGSRATVARQNLDAHCWREAEELYRRLQDYPGLFHTAQHGLDQALYGLGAEADSVAVTHDEPQTASAYESVPATAGSALPVDNTRLANIQDQRESLERRRRPTRLFGQTGMQRIPAVTPIAIEAAGNLGPILQEDGSDLTPEFAQHLELMRWGLDDLLGIIVPTVRVRINQSDLPDGAYIIMLNEIPLVSGSLDLTRGLCNETVDRLALLNVKGQEAINPANGSECSWVGQDDWQKVKDTGLDIWKPAEYIILHLSAVIRKNPTEFVGIQAVVDLLRDKAEEQYSRILSARGGLPRFTSVIQALLAEEVPIKELPSICDCYLDSLNLPTYDIPEEIRCLESIREDIMGNIPDTPIYRLGENLVTLIAHGIHRDGEAAVLALEPGHTQDALTAIRNEVANLPPISRNPVIFVEDWRMRPFVRKLVELEFPYLAVLSRRESIDPDSRHVLATIEMELRPHSESR